MDHGSSGTVPEETLTSVPRWQWEWASPEPVITGQSPTDKWDMAGTAKYQRAPSGTVVCFTISYSGWGIVAGMSTAQEHENS